MIIQDTEKRVFTLQTRSTTYQMKADENGVLLHVYYGPKVHGGDLSRLIRYADRGFSPNPDEAGNNRTYSLDTLPQEYSGSGAGDFRLPSLELELADGSHVADLRYVGAAVQKGKYALTGLPAFFASPEEADTLVITLEDAADALVTQNIDIIADNVDMMGRTLAEFEDFEIRDFLDTSFEAQANAGSMAVGFLDNNSLIVRGHFDALPYEQFTNNITDWMKDSREYFERILAGLKTKLKTDDAVVICYSHPNLVRYLQNGINWVFTDDTQISGMKISYNFGIYTSSQDRVHIVTSMYVPEDSGLHFVVIPTTKDLITYKHFKYNAVIDRNYRDPVHPLTPNVMVTQRTLTCEVLPVQGRLTIGGRETYSPTTLKRFTSSDTAQAILGAVGSDAGMTLNLTKNGNYFVVNAAGTAATGAVTVDTVLFPGVSGNTVQLTMQLPGIAAGGTYVVKQTNAALEMFSTDPTIKQVGDDWVKTKTYTYEELMDGYALCLEEGEGALVQIFNAAAYIDGASPAVATVKVNNSITFQ